MGLHENRRLVPSSLRTISDDYDIMVIYVFLLFLYVTNYCNSFSLCDATQVKSRREKSEDKGFACFIDLLSGV